MIQFSLAKTRRRALYLSAAFAAAGFLTMGISGTATADIQNFTTPSVNPDTVTFWNDKVAGVNPNHLSVTAPDLNAVVLPSAGWANYHFVLNTTHPTVALADGGPVALYMGNRNNTSSYTISSLTFTGPDTGTPAGPGAVGFNSNARFDWVAGTLVINGNVEVNPARSNGVALNDALNFFDVKSETIISANGADTKVTVTGDVLDNGRNLSVGVGGTSLNNGEVPGLYGATTLEIGRDLLLENANGKSLATVDSSFNSSTLKVTGDIGELGGPGGAWLYDDVMPRTTPLISIVGAGTTWETQGTGFGIPTEVYTDWVPRNFDATTSAANIYTSSITIVTTGINDALVNDFNLATNTFNPATDAWVRNDAVNGDVLYEATDDLLAASVNVSVAPNITFIDNVTALNPVTGDAAPQYLQNNTQLTGLATNLGGGRWSIAFDTSDIQFTPHAGGGDITFTADDDLSVHIDSFSTAGNRTVEVFDNDPMNVGNNGNYYGDHLFDGQYGSLFDASTKNVLGANYDGAVTFYAGHDLQVHYAQPNFNANAAGDINDPATVRIGTTDGFVDTWSVTGEGAGFYQNSWIFITHNYELDNAGNPVGPITGNNLSHSGLSYTADAGDVEVDYNRNFVFVNSVGSNGLSYIAGRDVSITAGGVEVYDATSANNKTGSSGLNIDAYHSVYIDASLAYVAGELGYTATMVTDGGAIADADVTFDINTAHNRALGAGGMTIMAETGSIEITDDLLILAGTGVVDITANKGGALGVRDIDRGIYSPGDIVIGGNINATVYDTGATVTEDGIYTGGNIFITGKNPSGTAIMEVGGGGLNNIFRVAAGTVTAPTTANILVEVDNFVSDDWTVLRLDGNTSGNVTINTSTITRQTPLDDLGRVLNIVTALDNMWRYELPLVEGSFFISTGPLLLDVEERVAADITAATGTITIRTDNLVAADGLWLDGNADQIVLDVTDGGWWGLGGSIASLNSNLDGRLREFTPARVALVNDATTVTRWADDTWIDPDSGVAPGGISAADTGNDYDDVRVTTNLIYVPDTREFALYSTPYPDPPGTMPEATRYAQRIEDGSLYIGGDTPDDFYGTDNHHAANETTGFWTQTLVVGGGEYNYDGDGGVWGGHHEFNQTLLTIQDRLVMTNRGQIDIYDGGSIRFDYDAIERLTNNAGTLTGGHAAGTPLAAGNGHFNASRINMSGLNYYFVDAITLITEADEITDGVRTTSDVWGFKVTVDGQIVDASVPGADAFDHFHNVVISMTDPRLTYGANAADNLTDIGFDDSQFITNLDDSPFFNITHGWIGENQYAYGIHGITWQLDGNGNPHTLISRAPTHALGEMAGALLDSTWNWNGNGDDDDGMVNYNHITNLLYLSTSLGEYQRDITTISAGSNLNAAYMASHHVHKMALDRAGEYNRLVASVAARTYGDAPATGYENASAMNGLWINPYYQYKEMDDDFGNGVLGYDITSWGFVGGYDRQIVDQFRVGFYFGATQPQLEDNNGGDIDGKDFQLGIYGSWSDPNLFEVNVGLGFGWQDYEAERNVTITRHGNRPYHDRLTADYDGDSFDFNLEIAKPIFLENNVWLRPAIAYNFQSTSLDGFSEQSARWRGEGGDSLAQRVGDADLDQHFFRLGLSGGWDSDMFGISGKLFWVGRTGDDRPEATSHFLAPHDIYGTNPINRFRVEGAEADDSSINLGLNVNAYLNEEKTATFNVGFDTLLGSDEQAYMFNVGLSYQF